MVSKKSKKIVSCGTLVYRLIDNTLQILLIKQFTYKNQWGIPKGRIKENESYENCARRETFEETGINVELLESIPSIINKAKTVMPYLATPININDQPNVDDPDCEVSEAAWFNVNELPEILPYQFNMIKDAISLIKLKIKHNI